MTAGYAICLATDCASGPGACFFVCLILYVPSTIFQLYRDGSSRVEPVLS